MATKKSAKKSVKKAVKKSAKKAAKKASKKSPRSLEALQTSVFDSDVSERIEDDSAIYSSSMRDDTASYSSGEEGKEGSRFRMIGMAVLAIVVVLGFVLINRQCNKGKAPVQKPAIELQKPAEEKPVQDAQKPTEQKPTEEKPVEKPIEKPAVAATYTIVAGDTLTSIAKKTGFTAAEITKANAGVNLGKIKVGQTIKLPAK
jgi:LysM repeat protein